MYLYLLAAGGALVALFVWKGIAVGPNPLPPANAPEPRFSDPDPHRDEDNVYFFFYEGDGRFIPSIMRVQPAGRIRFYNRALSPAKIQIERSLTSEIFVEKEVGVQDFFDTTLSGRGVFRYLDAFHPSAGGTLYVR